MRIHSNTIIGSFLNQFINALSLQSNASDMAMLNEIFINFVTTYANETAAAASTNAVLASTLGQYSNPDFGFTGPTPMVPANHASSFPVLGAFIANMKARGPSAKQEDPNSTTNWKQKAEDQARLAHRTSEKLMEAQAENVELKAKLAKATSMTNDRVYTLVNQMPHTLLKEKVVAKVKEQFGDYVSPADATRLITAFKGFINELASSPDVVDSATAEETKDPVKPAPGVWVTLHAIGPADTTSLSQEIIKRNEAGKLSGIAGVTRMFYNTYNPAHVHHSVGVTIDATFDMEKVDSAQRIHVFVYDTDRTENDKVMAKVVAKALERWETPGEIMAVTGSQVHEAFFSDLQFKINKKGTGCSGESESAQEKGPLEANGASIVGQAIATGVIVDSEINLDAPLCNTEVNPVVLWAHIHRLHDEMKGPEHFATWKDAALAEQSKRFAATDRVAKLEKELQQAEQKLQEINVNYALEISLRHEMDNLFNLTGAPKQLPTYQVEQMRKATDVYLMAFTEKMKQLVIQNRKTMDNPNLQYLSLGEETSTVLTEGDRQLQENMEKEEAEQLKGSVVIPQEDLTSLVDAVDPKKN